MRNDYSDPADYYSQLCTIEDCIMEFGVEICPMCAHNVRSWLKEGVNGEIFLPCIRSMNACKNFYQCAHPGKKFQTNLQCIRYYREKFDGFTTIKFSNTGRRRFLSDTQRFL